jgi:hypothetical protein
VIALAGLEEPSAENQTVPSIHPILLNLLSLDALLKLRTTVRDVKQFYDQLKSLDPNGENGAISKNALLDTVDTSGINLETLESLLSRISKKAEGFNGVLAFFSFPQLESSTLYSS